MADQKQLRILKQGVEAWNEWHRRVQWVERKNIDLREADLQGAKLIGADLRGVNLRSAILRQAKLIEADLSGADLSGADISVADLRKANLSGAQGHSVLITGSKSEQLIEADGVGVERQADVLDSVGAEDVERDRTNAGHHAGFGADAAGILAQGHVPDVMGLVLDIPYTTPLMV